MISNDCPNSLLNKLRQPLDWIWNLIKFCALHQCYQRWLWWQWWQRWRNIWLANYKPFLLQTTLTSLMLRQISHSVPTHLWADRTSNLFQLIIISINRIGFGFSTRIAYLPKKSLIICLSNISSHMPIPHMLSIIFNVQSYIQYNGSFIFTDRVFRTVIKISFTWFARLNQIVIPLMNGRPFSNNYCNWVHVCHHMD